MPPCINLELKQRTIVYIYEENSLFPPHWKEPNFATLMTCLCYSSLRTPLDEFSLFPKEVLEADALYGDRRRVEERFLLSVPSCHYIPPCVKLCGCC